MPVVPKEFLDLLERKKAFAHLATVMANGTPQVTPVWFDYHDGRIRVNTARGRVKDRNMTANPNVALSMMDPDDAYRYLQIRGWVVKVTEQGADEHIDSLAMKYLGRDKYPFRSPNEVRVIFEIEPKSCSVMG